MSALRGPGSWAALAALFACFLSFEAAGAAEPPPEGPCGSSLLSDEQIAGILLENLAALIPNFKEDRFDPAPSLGIAYLAGAHERKRFPLPSDWSAHSLIKQRMFEHLGRVQKVLDASPGLAHAFWLKLGNWLNAAASRSSLSSRNERLSARAFRAVVLDWGKRLIPDFDETEKVLQASLSADGKTLILVVLNRWNVRVLHAFDFPSLEPKLVGLNRRFDVLGAAVSADGTHAASFELRRDGKFWLNWIDLRTGEKLDALPLPSSAAEDASSDFLDLTIAGDEVVFLHAKGKHLLLERWNPARRESGVIYAFPRSMSLRLSHDADPLLLIESKREGIYDLKFVRVAALLAGEADSELARAPSSEHRESFFKSSHFVQAGAESLFLENFEFGRLYRRLEGGDVHPSVVQFPKNGVSFNRPAGAYGRKEVHVYLDRTPMHGEGGTFLRLFWDHWTDSSEQRLHWRLYAAESGRDTLFDKYVLESDEEIETRPGLIPLGQQGRFAWFVTKESARLLRVEISGVNE